MSAEEIVRGLRRCADGKSCSHGLCGGCPADGVRTTDGACDDGIMLAAADLIEAKTAETAKLLERIAELEGQLAEETSRRYQAECNYDHWKADCEQLRAQLAASQQETRAAVEDIRQACATCAHSKKASCPWEGTYHHRGEHGEKIGVCNAWQWRGHQAAKEETKQ